MLEVGKLTSYLGGKFLLSNIKKEKEDIIYKSQVLSQYNKEYLGKDKYFKTYYDTPDFIFRNAGINICRTQVKGKPNGEIVVRYDSEKKRVNFLNFMPDTYTLTIPAKDSIMQYKDFVAKAITELITNGLQVNMLQLVNTMVPLLTVSKKRDRFRVVGSNGLKMVMSFDNVIYSNAKNPKEKEKLDVLDIVSGDPKLYGEIYEETTKDLVIENPTIVKTHHSDLFVGLDYVFNMKS